LKKNSFPYHLGQLNAITHKDAYSLPHIDTCHGSMNGAVWYPFSTLDLRSG